jgi:hypothetical protein
MADPAGEADRGTLRPDFNRRLVLRFHGMFRPATDAARAAWRREPMMAEQRFDKRKATGCGLANRSNGQFGCEQNHAPSDHGIHGRIGSFGHAERPPRGAAS